MGLDGMVRRDAISTADTSTTIAVQTGETAREAATLPTHQSQDALTQSYGFVWRWPWEPSKQDGKRGATEAARVRAERQQKNQTDAENIEKDLLADRQEVLDEMEAVIRAEIVRLKKHAEYIDLRRRIKNAHADGQDALVFQTGMIIGSQLSRTITLQNEEGFPEGSRFSAVGKEAIISIPQIDNAMLTNLPAMQELDALVDEVAASNHDIALHLRDTTFDENAVLQKMGSEIEGKQIIAYNFVVSCSHPEPENEAGTEAK